MVCYLCDLLIMLLYKELEIGVFMIMWNCEEFWYGEVFVVVLVKYGIMVDFDELKVNCFKLGWKDCFDLIK